MLAVEDLPQGLDVSAVGEIPVPSDKAAFERFGDNPSEGLQNFGRWGRLLGFRREFDNSDQPDRGSDLFLASEAEVYRSEDGASQAFAAHRRHYVGLARLVEVEDPSSLGEERAAFRLSPAARSEGGRLTDGYVLVWRRERVLAFLRVSVTGGEIDRSLLVQTGHAADGRIAEQVPNQ